MARQTFILRDGQLVEKKTGTALAIPNGPLCAPTVIGDIPEYRSPIDGRMITSRSERREDLRRNNCVEAGDTALSLTKGKREFKNARFAKKHGLKLSESARQ